MPRLPVAAAAAALLAFATAAHAASDREFLKDALEGDNSEMTLGRMAQRQGASPGVRDFGRKLAMDHAKAKRDAARVARRMDVPVTDEMTRQARTESWRLGHLSGRDFDQEFVRYMVEDHRKDIEKFEEQARTGAPATRRLAAQTLPALRTHLQIAESLQSGRQDRPGRRR